MGATGEHENQTKIEETKKKIAKTSFQLIFHEFDASLLNHWMWWACYGNFN